MDAVGDDDAAMMAAMGMAGFGSTKVRCFCVSGWMMCPRSVCRVRMSKGIRKVH